MVNVELGSMIGADVSAVSSWRGEGHDGYGRGDNFGPKRI